LAQQRFRAIAPRDKRSKTDRKRRRKDVLTSDRQMQRGSTAALGMANIDEGSVGHE
jgi:hypothetical protein